MTTKVAINGFGRIGRLVLRAAAEADRKDLEFVAINDLAPLCHAAHLLKYDSVHGRLRADVATEDGALVADGRHIRYTGLRDPEQLPWGDVDIVFECTGRFTSREGAVRHLKNGARRVLISAPGSDVDRTVVFGVNHMELSAEDVIVSNASCTTNSLAPIAMVLNDSFGIETGYMTTIHAFTGDQPSHDANHDDLYRARAASMSMVPTSTGAARAISQVLPRLAGRLEGSAIRVPTPNVSLIDLTFMPSRKATRDAVNAAIRQAAEGPLRGVLAYEEDPLVSIDFNHDPHSSCFAAGQTTVTRDGMVRVVSWYDNEWGFSNRMLDTGRRMGKLMSAEPAPRPMRIAG